MRVLVLAVPTSERTQLMDSLRAWGVRELVQADSWGDFMKLAISERPDWCLLSLQCLVAAGHEALTSTEWTLKALNRGAIISVAPEVATVQYEVEASTEFELFVPEPVDMQVLAPLVARLTGVELHPPATTHTPSLAAAAASTSGELSWTEELAADLDSEFGEDDAIDFMDFPITGSSPVVASSGSGRHFSVSDVQRTSDSGAVAGGAVPGPAAVSSDRASSVVVPLDMSVTRKMSAMPIPRISETPRSQQQIYREPIQLPAPSIESMPAHLADGGAPSADFVADLENEQPVNHVQNDSVDADGLSEPQNLNAGVNGPGTTNDWSGCVTDGSSDSSSPDSPDVESGSEPFSATQQAYPAPETTVAQPSDGVGSEAARVHLVTLNGVRAGVIQGAMIPKILFGLYMTQATGRMRFVQDSLQRDVLVLGGTVGRIPADATLSDEARLLGTFGWETGTYIFEEDPFESSSFQSFGHPLDLIYRGITTRLSVDTVMKPLTQHLRSFPVCTTALQWMEEVPSLQRVSATLNALAGVLPLERAIVSVGDSPDDVLRRAYFGWLTGSLIFQESPNAERVPVQFASDFMNEDPAQLANVRRMADTMARKRRVTQSSTNLSGLSRNAPGQPVAEPIPMDPAIEQAARELNGLLRGFANRPPHAALGLELGCGLTALSSRYYELVRLYHPDRYAKGYSDDIRALAQRVFLEIRIAHERAQSEEEAGVRAAGQVVANSGTGVAGAGTDATGVFQAVSASSGVNAAAASGVASHAPGQVRKVSDVLERVRARHASGMTGTYNAVAMGPSSESAANRPAPSIAPPNEFANSSPSFRKVATLSSRPTVSTPAVGSSYAGIAPEQLFRNAKRALVAGANSKALELLDAAKERGVSGPSIDAHELYLRYSLQELSAVRVLPQLEELAKSVGQEAELSQVFVLLGHVLRMEERSEKALDFYTKALEADKLNEEASRWARHLRSRTEKTAGSGQGFLNKILNAKITLSPTKK